MNEVQRTNSRALVLFMVICVGCGASDASLDDMDRAPAPHGKNLPGGGEVRLVEVVGDYARVELADGSVGFVDKNALLSRTASQGKKSAADATHRIAGDVLYYSELPNEPPPPRSLTQITQERPNLNCLYLGEKTGCEVIAECHQRTVEHPSTGERCLRAYECSNPSCPGEATHDRPYLFGVGPEHARSDGIACPACLTIRSRESESEQERFQYIAWPRPYELPETMARLKQLSQERRRAQKKLRRDSEG